MFRSGSAMRLLILKTPHDPARGVGIPETDFAWLASLYAGEEIDVQLADATDLRSVRHLLEPEVPDLVFCTTFDVIDREGKGRVVLHQLLDGLGIPYVGSSPETLELALSKYKFKETLRDAGIATPDYALYRDGQFLGPGAEPLEDLSDFPYLLKPGREGNSRGINEDNIVFDRESLHARLAELSEIYTEVLVESYLGVDEGLREFTVAMVGNPPDRQCLPAEILLLVKRDRRLITTDDKTHHHTQAVPVEDPGLNRKLARLASSAFEAIEARDYARCDLILAEGRLQVIEVNGQPMIPDLWFDACAESAGLTRADYCLAILRAGRVRAARDGSA